MSVGLKRVYDPPAPEDGLRVLVDRVWPRGVSKAEAEVDEWAGELAPTAELRKWFGHDAKRWLEFRRRYEAELASIGVKPHLDALRDRVRRERVTLLYGAKDEEHNQAVVLAELLRG